MNMTTEYLIARRFSFKEQRLTTISWLAMMTTSTKVLDNISLCENSTHKNDYKEKKKKEQILPTK